ncbi:MAG: glycosyltransferase [Chloroflexi bacterium]|nr:glycosyltransferase [Chloroflexota bacterium]
MARERQHRGGPLRVVHLIRDDTYGQLRHAQNLQSVAGVESVFVGPPGAAARLPGSPVVVSDLPRRPSLRTITEARRLSGELRRFAPAAVHAHSVATLLPGMLIARSLGVPLVHSPHALPVPGLSGSRAEVTIAGGMIRLAASARARFVAVSVDEHRQLVRAAGVRAPVDLVLNPVPERYLAPWPAVRPGNVVLSLSRFWPQKEPALTIRAFAALLREVPEARLRWAGDGPLLDGTRALAAELGVAGSVEFLGPVPDPLPLLQEASLLVSSSQFEAMPYSILEAMATGTAIVATGITAHREVDGGTGALALVPAEPVQIARRMADLLLDPEARGTQQAAARRRVESAYSLQEFAARMREIYTAVAAARPATISVRSAGEVRS